MTSLSIIDLQILHLGIIRNGRIDEVNISNSELNKLGVGRILDQLASLKERNLIEMNKDGSFSITEKGRKIFWDENIPLEIKILRILEIAPQESNKLASLLLVSKVEIQSIVDKLQKKHLVVMVTIKKENRFIRTYEIMHEGLEFLEKTKQENFQNISGTDPPINNIKIIRLVIKEIEELSDIRKDIKDKIISNLLVVKKNLESGLL